MCPNNGWQIPNSGWRQVLVERDRVVPATLPLMAVSDNRRLFPSSSMVEQDAVNVEVVGPSPTGGAQRAGWS